MPILLPYPGTRPGEGALPGRRVQLPADSGDAACTGGWEKIKEYAGNLTDMVIGGIRD